MAKKKTAHKEGKPRKKAAKPGTVAATAAAAKTLRMEHVFEAAGLRRRAATVEETFKAFATDARKLHDTIEGLEDQGLDESTGEIFPGSTLPDLCDQKNALNRLEVLAAKLR